MAKTIVICIGPQVSTITERMLTGLLSGMEGITLVEEPVTEPAARQIAPQECTYIVEHYNPPPEPVIEDKRPYWRKFEKHNRS